MTFQLGPDDPATRETDILKRLELACSIESLIKATLENLTVRVGVFGRWGEGKTSVLRLVESFAQEDSKICVRLNPSLVADRAELTQRCSSGYRRQIAEQWLAADHPSL
jgi:hypothetical protein